jgi:NADPH:quinone reductase-like Zn-dependent oxidoreductase
MAVARAIVAAGYGGPDQLEIREHPVAAPGPGEVTVEVRAAGVNPIDYKLFSGLRGDDPAALPLPVGFEVAGVLGAIGPGTEIAYGGGAIGDPVLAFPVRGGYSSALTIKAADVFAKPERLDFAEAANLLSVGTTVADMLRVVPVRPEATVVIHGASGAVGTRLLQRFAELGVRAIGTASPAHFDLVRRFGGEPVAYGEGLEERLSGAAPDGFDGGFDCVGTDEAIDASLTLLDASRLVTIVAGVRAAAEGFEFVGSQRPDSVPFRNSVRRALVEEAAERELSIPIAHTFPLDDASAALSRLMEGHPGGKLALIP